MAFYQDCPKVTRKPTTVQATYSIWFADILLLCKSRVSLAGKSQQKQANYTGY